MNMNFQIRIFSNPSTEAKRNPNLSRQDTPWSSWFSVSELSTSLSALRHCIYAGTQQPHRARKRRLRISSNENQYRCQRLGEGWASSPPSSQWHRSTCMPWRCMWWFWQTHSDPQIYGSLKIWTSTSMDLDQFGFRCGFVFILVFTRTELVVRSSHSFCFPSAYISRHLSSFLCFSIRLWYTLPASAISQSRTVSSFRSFLYFSYNADTSSLCL